MSKKLKEDEYDNNDDKELVVVDAESLMLSNSTNASNGNCH